MKIFIDSVDPKVIEKYVTWGMVDGVTTNPSLMAKSGRPILEVLKELTDLVQGSVSAEVIATDYEGMMKESVTLRSVAPNITVKVPLTPDGLRACRAIRHEGGTVNVTLCFSANQALLAAKAGATYISPFLGRIDDSGACGVQLVQDIRRIYDNYGFETQILAASLRHPHHVLSVAKVGAHVATLPGGLLEKLYAHPMTDMGLEAFLKDWHSTMGDTKAI